MFFSVDGDEETLEDITSSLVFYNGNISLNDVDGNPINYWITDDLLEMNVLNDQKMCYLYTNSERDIAGKKIAIKKTSLPQFTRYMLSDYNVISS
jgi:hypothetical protein|nr:MAG TPA: hypothetical protein [Caudoviricetes sp.]